MYDLFVSVCLSLLVSLCLCLCMSLSFHSGRPLLSIPHLSASLYVSICLSPPSASLPSLCFSVSVCVCVCVCLLTLSLTPSIPISPSLRISALFFLSLPL